MPSPAQRVCAEHSVDCLAEIRGWLCPCGWCSRLCPHHIVQCATQFAKERQLNLWQRGVVKDLRKNKFETILGKLEEQETKRQWEHSCNHVTRPEVTKVQLGLVTQESRSWDVSSMSTSSASPLVAIRVLATSRSVMFVLETDVLLP